MKSLTVLATCAILLCGCGGTAQTPTSSAANYPTPSVSISPIPDDIGLVLLCNNCAFVDENGARSISGQVKNEAKQALTGYVLAVDLQDAKGTSVKKIPLMLMSAMVLQPGETKDFKDRLVSTEKNVTQAVVYFKKAGKEVKLSDSLTLKMNAPPISSAPAKAKVAATPAKAKPAPPKR